MCRERGRRERDKGGRKKKGGRREVELESIRVRKQRGQERGEDGYRNRRYESKKEMGRRKGSRNTMKRLSCVREKHGGVGKRRRI